MTRLAIIDYGSGNLRSVQKAFEHVADAGTNVTITSDPAALDAATHIVLPGVGAFGDCIAGLNALPGLRDALERNVRGARKPFLGICVGMQLLFDEGHEHGVHQGLGWIAGKIIRLSDDRCQVSEKHTSPATCHLPPVTLKIPHMGWNELRISTPHPLLQDLKNGDHAYFVHSYHASCDSPSSIVATVDYGGPVTAIVAQDNIMGTQFHPEKSQQTGLNLLRNFLKLR